MQLLQEFGGDTLREASIGSRQDITFLDELERRWDAETRLTQAKQAFEEAIAADIQLRAQYKEIWQNVRTLVIGSTLTLMFC